MLILTDQELAKLKYASGDRVLIEGLKKLFLKEFLFSDRKQGVQELAAAMLATEFLQDGFHELARLKEESREPKEEENIV